MATFLTYLGLLLRYLPTILRLLPAVIALIHEIESGIASGKAMPNEDPRADMKRALTCANEDGWSRLCQLYWRHRKAREGVR